jgi:hypothetical protein
MTWTVAVRFPVRARDFSLLHINQTGSGAYPVSCPMSTAVLSPEIKQTTHLHLVQMPRIVELYLHSLIRFPGVVFN